MYFDTQLVITVLPYSETGNYRGTRYPEFLRMAGNTTSVVVASMQKGRPTIGQKS